MDLSRVSPEMIISDHEVAVDWYQRLLGREPDERPMGGLAEWQLTDDTWLQVFADAERAGRSAMTLGVANLDSVVDELAGRSLELDRQTTPRGQQLGLIFDPDGNQINFASGV